MKRSGKLSKSSEKKPPMKEEQKEEDEEIEDEGPEPIPEPFPSPFTSGNYGDGVPARSVVELTMMALSNEIRNKPDWPKKLTNEDILQKWKKEAHCTPEQFQYVIDELKYLARISEPPYMVSAVDGVWLADGIISEDLKSEFKKSVSQLENIPTESRDYHPGSNQQIWDLVHPSLYCLVNHRSLVIRKHPVVPALSWMGVGEPVEFNEPETGYYVSEEYQWLPADFRVYPNGSVKIESYINNLHPVHFKALYRSIGLIFERFVPLFEKVLAEELKQRPPRVHVDHWYREEQQEPEDEDDEDSFKDTRAIHHPPVPKFSEYPEIPKISLKNRKLQVFVKLANTELTPENPKFSGGTWHVEGMLNESIVSTGIYYYHFENITPSKLAFRQAVCEPDYEQNDNRGVEEIYALVDEEPLCQDWGQVLTCEDRALAFPNIYQHQVQPFKLEDKTTNGRRKILVFFLVDPSREILSTAHVPPQQKEWFMEEVKRRVLFFRKLPVEVFNKIMDYLEWPMMLEEAKKHRERLMTERKTFRDTNNEEYFQRPFSLCEH